MPGEGIGAYLRGERERQALSFDDILERTRLQPHILEALEAEDWDRLPSPAFAKGFLRNYVSALGLDPAAVLERFGEELPRRTAPLKPLTQEVRHRGPGPLLLVAGLLLICLLGFLLWSSGSKKSLEEPASTAPSEIDSAADVRVPPDTGQDPEPVEAAPSTGNDLPEKSPETSGPQLDASAQPEPPLAGENTAGAFSEPAPAETLAEMESPPAKLTLKMQVMKRTWVKIFVDDQRPEERIFVPGEEKVWHAEKGFEMRIGNAGGISLELNGQPVQNLGREGQVIRLNLPAGYERRRQER
ncbi:conserved hypothetical protein [uncultured Desulfatiglans sp.]|nr:conserved hypothetical protein [uncultured Desulfatiglans sp.]